MSGSQEDRKSRGGCGAAVSAVTLLVLLPVLYVLSIGPAVMLAEKGMIRRASVESFYTPISPLFDVPIIRSMLESYINLWI